MKVIRVSAMWCPGCLVMNKIWNEVQKKYPDLEVINYDYDFDEDEVAKFNVGKLLPVNIFIGKNGKEMSRLTGEKTFDEIEEVILNYEEK